MGLFLFQLFDMQPFLIEDGPDSTRKFFGFFGVGGIQPSILPDLHANAIAGSDCKACLLIDSREALGKRSAERISPLLASRRTLR